MDIRKRHLQHRWNVTYNFLLGISAGDWWRLLRENHFHVSPMYCHRALCISALSPINSINRWREHRRYGERIARTRITKAPVCILGHWRSGTTLLHNILAEDTAQFTAPTTYQVMHPHTFLTTEAFATRWLSWLVPATRPQDNMALSMQSPQEEEFAIGLTTLKSPYLGIAFPQREQHYARYYTFDKELGAEAEAWQQALLWFIKKLTLQCDRRVVLKSPANTARIRLILEQFPEARFLHIVRHPYRVFQSSWHTLINLFSYMFLQQPDTSTVVENILQRYNVLYDAYFAQKSLIPARQLYEVRFEDLERHPLETVEGIYDGLRLPGLADCRPTLEAYLRTVRTHRKNAYPELDPDMRQRIAQAWERTFRVWGYAL